MKEKMPVLFVGHGSPMNAIEENEFSEGWKRLGRELPAPKAILAMSAHWVTDGTLLCAAERPRMIYDMYGFPEELYRVVYPVPGNPALARRAAALLGGKASADLFWGIDHGVWSVLRWMYPDAEIPVVEMSVDGNAAPEELLRMGEKLRPLREEGVLLLASGNVVHNLSLLDWDLPGGYAWADEFDGWVRDRVLAGRYDAVLHWQSAGDSAKKAFRTSEHFVPLLCALGAADNGDRAETRNEARTMGAMSMTCYLFSPKESKNNNKGE